MLTKEKEEVIKHYDTGLKAYKLRKWDEAIAEFEMALKIDPEDGPSKLYLQRSNDFKASPPPEDWDGVFTMKTK
ncbi:tetratricopeptide repeat protein [Spirochaetota bacterium]